MSLHAVAPGQVSEQDGFFPAAPDSKWYENLKRSGSCLQLLELLTADRTLIHALGREDMTVLHKGVRHGCVALVRFILVDVFDDRGHCKCSRHGADAPLPGLTREQLLRKTCSYGSSAVNMAVVSGSPKMVVLLEWAIKMCRRLSEQPSKGMPSKEVENIDEYRTLEAFHSRYMEKMGREEKVQTESTNITGDGLPAPEVRDDDLSMLYPSSSEVKSKVVSVIEGVLRDPGDEHRQWMGRVEEWIAVDVDFEFVPLAHVFLHFLCSVSSYGYSEDGFYAFRKAVTKRIFEACGGGDGEDGESGSMLTTLFNILDPRGRTLLHVDIESKGPLRTVTTDFQSIEDLLLNIPPSVKAECLKARDGAGRSISHLMAIHDWVYPYKQLRHQVGDLALIERLSSPQDINLDVLKQWCFPLKWDPNLYKLTPLDIAVLVNGRGFSSSIWLTNGSICPSTWIDEERSCRSSYTLLQLAALLGRAGLIEDMLKHHTKFKSLIDRGLGYGTHWSTTPAIHCAALYGQVEAIQSILIHWSTTPAIHYAALYGQVEAIQSILKYPYMTLWFKIGNMELLCISFWVSNILRWTCMFPTMLFCVMCCQIQQHINV